MRTLILLCSSLFIFQVYGQDLQSAQTLYQNRATTGNAMKAADAFKKLAAAETDLYKKMDLMVDYGKSLYYYGFMSSDDSVKVKVHEEAYKEIESLLAQMGVTYANKKMNFSQDLSKYNDSEKTTLANAFYMMGTNLAKWGEAKGITSSLSNRPKLEAAMNAMIELGKEDLYAYGAYRTLARVLYKVPFTDKAKGYSMMRTVMKNTLTADKISSYGLNNIYYAEYAYKFDPDKSKRQDRACRVLKRFAAVDVATYNPDRIPEETAAVLRAKQLIQDFKCQ